MTLKELFSYRPEAEIRRYIHIQKADTLGTLKSIEFYDKHTAQTIKEFAEYFNMPKRTLEDWEADARKCQPYLLELIEYKLRKEKIIK